MTREHVKGSRHVIDICDDDVDPRARSRVSNGRRPADVDGRSSNARRLRDITAELTSALGSEPDMLERALVARVAAMMLTAERLEATLANGDDVDADQLIRLSRAIGRVLHQLDLVAPADPQPRKRSRTRKGDDGMDVKEYLASIGLSMEGSEPVAVSVNGDATGLDELLDDVPITRRPLPPVVAKDHEPTPRRRPHRGDDHE
jgi:sulfur carrier protein ThiS